MYRRCFLQSIKKKRQEFVYIPNLELFHWCNEESSESRNYRNDNKGLCAVARGCVVGHYHKDGMCLCCRVSVCEGAGQRDNNY